MGIAKLALIGIAVGAASSPIWGTFLWVLWQGFVRPRLIPQREIDALAAEMLARYGPRAEEAASAEEELAWRNSETFERGKWRRVRQRISRLDSSTKTKK